MRGAPDKEERMRIGNLKRMADQAKKVIDKRGGTGALKDDADELKEIAKGEGSLKEKAKSAARAIKDPGAAGKQRTPKKPPKKAPN